jgi:Sulfotransferase domain
MLQVIGAGLPRTGTTSTKAALERLGFGPCYHMFEIITHPDHVDRWLPAATGRPLDWGRVLAGYRATQDWPASHFWREQAEAFPEAKVILTVRDPHPWFVSFRTLIARRAALDHGDDVPARAAAVMDGMRRLAPVLNTIGRALFGPDWHFGMDMTDERAAVAAFDRHVAEVTEAVPARRLLIFDVHEGWRPLCDFLGVETPEEPFPHLNDSQSMQRNIEQMMATGRLVSPFDDTP